MKGFVYPFRCDFHSGPIDAGRNNAEGAAAEEEERNRRRLHSAVRE
jgi:hypothetical protein